MTKPMTNDEIKEMTDELEEALTTASAVANTAIIHMRMEQWRVVITALRAMLIGQGGKKQ